MKSLNTPTAIKIIMDLKSNRQKYIDLNSKGI
jgi:hypothetical protein